MTQPPHAPHEIANHPRTIGEGGGRVWIHAVKIYGRWQKRRRWIMLILLAILYLTPWLKVGNRPFIKLSFLDTSFVLFGNYILVHEFYHFVLLAILLVLTLFLASSLVGRVWCGYACPQTIFVEHILGWIETLCEGPAIKRLADQKKPMTLNRILRKIAKHVLYILVSFSFAFTLVAMFTGPESLLAFESRAAWVAISLLTGLAWFDGGYWREQFCHIACPYARFQGLMQDNQTITIGYDQIRGEPRGRKKEGDIGDCIDCGLCVRACPSGIDIRQGASQQECTACARCIDACDQVMTSLSRPTGLIRYDSLSEFSETKDHVRVHRIVRPRLVIYAFIWLGVFSIGIWQFIHRNALHVKILSVPGSAPYFVDHQNVKNLTTLKVGNQSSHPDVYSIQLAENFTDFVIESPVTLGPIDPGKESSLPLLISANLSTRGNHVSIEVKSQNTGEIVTVRKIFARPEGRLN